MDIEWNSGSLHPLGDIFLKALAPGLTNNASAPVVQVNDDSDYTLHFLPAVSVRSDGAICSSWYDRRLGGASSTLTDMKANLSALRLIHFLSVALLVKRYIGQTSRLLQWPVFAPAIRIGSGRT